jgi:hypothetical protein
MRLLGVLEGVRDAVGNIGSLYSGYKFPSDHPCNNKFTLPYEPHTPLFSLGGSVAREAQQ